MITKEGMQFKVQIYEDKVIKRLKTRNQQRLFMLNISRRPWQIYTILFNLIKSKDIVGRADQRIFGIMKAIAKSRMPKILLANAKINGSVITQTRCRPITRIVTKEGVDKFIALNLELWKYGFFEYVFNFHRNCGIIKNKMVLFDFGEMMLSEEEALKKMEQKPWFKSLSFRFHLHKDIKQYYIEQCNKHFTKENLTKLWRSKC